MTDKAKEAKTCDTCKKSVPFPLWYHQRKSLRFRLTRKTLCATCIAKQALGKKK